VSRVSVTRIGCNRFPWGILPSLFSISLRIRRRIGGIICGVSSLDATAWSNPRYQPIGSRLRGESNWEQKDPIPFLSLSLSLSLYFSLAFCFIDREAAAIAMQATTKTTTAYNPRARHRFHPPRKQKLGTPALRNSW